MDDAIDDFSGARLHGAFFSLIAADVDRVVAARNLSLETYRHDLPRWQLHFKHPKGGHCGIQILRNGKSQVALFGVWNQCDYVSGTTRIYVAPRLEAQVADGSLEGKLHAMIDDLVAHPLGDWTSISTGHAADCHNVNREQFERLTEYPAVRPRA